MTQSPYYIGGELELFAAAVNWKAYLRSQIYPLLGRRVLEVGAGIGAVTKTLCDDHCQRWLCLEPDPIMAERLRAEKSAGTLQSACEIHQGILWDIDVRPDFDSVIYIDVLEHIETDAQELIRATGFLRNGGRLIVLAPAHKALFSAFDRAVGHFRRYNRQSLVALSPPDVRLVKTRYLDCIGLGASLANRLMLHDALPSTRQIWIWDRLMVPISRVFDRLTGYTIGKSVIAVWEKLADET